MQGEKDLQKATKKHITFLDNNFKHKIQTHSIFYAQWTVFS